MFFHGSFFPPSLEDEHGLLAVSAPFDFELEACNGQNNPRDFDESERPDVPTIVEMKRRDDGIEQSVM